jgi:hypothetical protein
MAIDTALSLTLGAALILGLVVAGKFHLDAVLQSFIGETIPLLNFLPFWSIMVHRCISRDKEGAEGGGVFSTAFKFATAGATGGVASLAGTATNLSGARFSASKTSSSSAASQGSARAPMLNARIPSEVRRVAKGATLAILLCFSFSASAQAVPDPIQYIVAPETPGASETVLIEVQGVGSFLGDATISWSVDGKAVKSGVGERTFTFTTGALGSNTTVRAAIDSSRGYFTRTFTFTPSRINLIWEADTTVPPLYKGKALYSAGSSYKVVAFPTVYSGNSRISSSALSYQWFYRDEAVAEQSGLGRNIFTGTGDQLQQSEELVVEVYYGARKVGRGALSLSSVEPAVLFFERDPLRGVLYDSALPSRLSLVAKEITVQAEPFFFSTASRQQGLVPFSWTLNDEETSGPDSSRGIVTLRQAGNGAGSATLGLSLQNNNPDQFVQTAQSSLYIEFGAEGGNALLDFFGL